MCLCVQILERPASSLALVRPLAARVYAPIVATFSALGVFCLSCRLISCCSAAEVGGQVLPARKWCTPPPSLRSRGSPLLAASLPLNAELITLQVLFVHSCDPHRDVFFSCVHQALVGKPAGTTLIRLANPFAVGEDPNLSRPVTVSVQSLFPDRQVKTTTPSLAC